MHVVPGLPFALALAVSAEAQQPVATLTIAETTAGQGDTLVVGDIATLCWIAKKDDGSVYEDHTNERQPMQLRVGPQVPHWWEEGLQRMRPGGAYRVEVPIDRMWPASGLPAALRGCKHVVYEVRVLRAIRMPRFQKLDAAKAKDEAGFPTEVLAGGHGKKPAKDHWCSFHFVAFNATGDVIDSSHALEKPMRARPDALDVPFLAAILPRMTPGARWLCTSPVTAGHPRWAGILGSREIVTWQVELLAVTPPLPLPAFAPPAAEAMRASASGVRVSIDGGGQEASPRDGVEQVRVHFACWLADGTLVESTYAAGQPSELELAKLPRGISEGILRIPGGAAAWLRIPAAQGYGGKGHPARKVPPDAELILRVELLAIGK